MKENFFKIEDMDMENLPKNKETHFMKSFGNIFIIKKFIRISLITIIQVKKLLRKFNNIF